MLLFLCHAREHKLYLRKQLDLLLIEITTKAAIFEAVDTDASVVNPPWVDCKYIHEGFPDSTNDFAKVPQGLQLLYGTV